MVYGYGIGDVITGLFTRIAPKILPIGKEIASNAIGALGDKIGSTAADVFGAAKEKLVSLVQRKKPVKLSSTDQMPSDIGKEINELAKQNVGAIAGSGLKRLQGSYGL